MNFSYPQFAAALFLNGVGMGVFAAPNRTGIMNSLPAGQRGVGAGMSTVFQNSAMVLSIGIFFSLMITGLAHSLPAANAHYLTGQAFFPSLISGPFAGGLAVAFGFAIAACVVAAIASALRGGKFVYTDTDMDAMPAVH